jgi:hypothetical protein
VFVVADTGAPLSFGFVVDCLCRVGRSGSTAGADEDVSDPESVLRCSVGLSGSSEGEDEDVLDPESDPVLDPDPEPEPEPDPDPVPLCSPVVESVLRCNVGRSGSDALLVLEPDPDPDPEPELDPLPLAEDPELEPDPDPEAEPDPLCPELDADPDPESPGGLCAKCGLPSSGGVSFTNWGSVFDGFSFDTFGGAGF